MTRSVAIPVLAIAVACGDDTATPDAPGGDGAPATCETTSPWAGAPPMMLGPTQETAAVALDGSLYVIGGFHVNDGIVAATQIFSPVTCTWLMGPELPQPIHHANVAVAQGRLYLLGGLETTSFAATGATFMYDPVAGGGWVPRAAMPAGTERGSAVVGVIDDKIYVAGGFRGGAAVTDVTMYDPSADTWTTTGLPALPQRRDHACGGVVGGKLYVIGGRQAAITSTAGTVFELAPGGAWLERAPMPTPRGGTACGVVGDRIVVAGGEGNPDAPSGVFPDVESFDPVANAWTTLPAMPTPRHGLGAAAIDGRIYFPGGATRQGFGAVATHEILTP